MSSGICESSFIACSVKVRQLLQSELAWVEIGP